MKAPKFPSFFKTTTNKQFELPVRYYDESKDRIQTALNKANTEKEVPLEKGHFTNAWKKKSTTSFTSSTLRVIIIAIFLCLIASWILKL